MAAATKLSPSPPRASGVVLRPPLAAALAFLDASRENRMDARELVAWLDGYLVRPGILPMPSTVQEPAVGVVSLRELPTGAWASSFEAKLGRIVVAARLRVSLSLDGLLASPPDDRFLSAAIFAGRVERSAITYAAGWRATPRGTERLSDVVLSLLVADILSHREEYEASLCVCGICGRVSLSRTALRNRCSQHSG